MFTLMSPDYDQDAWQAVKALDLEPDDYVLVGYEHDTKRIVAVPLPDNQDHEFAYMVEEWSQAQDDPEKPERCLLHELMAA